METQTINGIKYIPVDRVVSTMYHCRKLDEAILKYDCLDLKIKLPRWWEKAVKVTIYVPEHNVLSFCKNY